MKVLALVASPRQGGNVDQLVDGVLAGARDGGAAVEKVNLCHLNLKRCTACMRCRTTHACHLVDDLDGLFHKIVAADAVVVGAPLYWSNIPSQLMAVHERLTGYVEDFASPRQLPKRRLPRGKKVVFLTSCSAPFPFSALLGMTGGVFRAMGVFWRVAGFKVVGRLAETGTWHPGPPAPRKLAQARRLGQRLVGVRA
jgi:multimeric flavodoxin WrbA